MHLSWLFRKTTPPLWFSRVGGSSVGPVDRSPPANSLITLVSHEPLRVNAFNEAMVQQQLDQLGIQIGSLLEVVERTPSAVLVQCEGHLISLAWDTAEAIQVISDSDPLEAQQSL